MTELKSSSCSEFIFGGLRQSGLVFAALLLLGAVGWVAAVYNVMRALGTVAFAFAASLISGPVPTVLVLFDISNKTLLVWSVVLIVPYWCCLGAAAGILRWRFASADPKQEQSAATARCRRQTRWTAEIMAFALAVVVFPLGPIAGPASANRRPRITNGIFNNLRQIDGAKQQFALQGNLPPEYVPTGTELEPYLRYLRPVGPERYVFNSIREAPCAVLDADWRIRRHGWREGFTIPRQEFRLPPQP